jgi:hypothetical protein
MTLRKILFWYYVAICKVQKYSFHNAEQLMNLTFLMDLNFQQKVNYAH